MQLGNDLVLNNATLESLIFVHLANKIAAVSLFRVVFSRENIFRPMLVHLRRARRLRRTYLRCRMLFHGERACLENMDWLLHSVTSRGHVFIDRIGHHFVCVIAMFCGWGCYDHIQNQTLRVCRSLALFCSLRHGAALCSCSLHIRKLRPSRSERRTTCQSD